MTPELLAQLAQLGATGLLAVVLYAGITQNKVIIEALLERDRQLIEVLAGQSKTIQTLHTAQMATRTNGDT